MLNHIIAVFSILSIVHVVVAMPVAADSPAQHHPRLLQPGRVAQIRLCSSIQSGPPCVQLACPLSTCCNIGDATRAKVFQHGVVGGFTFGPLEALRCGLFARPDCNDGMISAGDAALGFVEVVDLNLGWERGPMSFSCEPLFGLEG